MFLLYNLLMHLALPWLWARLWWRARSEPEYAERIAERFGVPPAGLPEGAVWFHCVSAGEAIGAAPVIGALVDRTPSRPVVVSTTTPAGAARVRALFGNRVQHFYAPYDLPWAVEAYIRVLRPRALVLVETELWPNLVTRVSRRAPVAVINARLSARSHRGYARARRVTRHVFGRLAAVLCQYEDTARRFQDLGVPASRLAVTGNVKFDVELPAPEETAADTWIAGSTHAPEDEIVLAAHVALRKRRPALRLILVPRHAVRAPGVVRLARSLGLSARLQSEGGRSEPGTPDEGTVDVEVGDIMGTLGGLYGAAAVAFLGGSLNDTGGHNPIEAAVHGRPMLMGPERRNFQEVCQRFEDAGCLHLVRDVDDLAREVENLLADPDRRRREGEAARKVVADNSGAVAKTMTALGPLLEPTMDL